MDDHESSDLPPRAKEALALADRYLLDSDVPQPEALTEEEQVGVLLQLMKYRIGSTTRIALGMDPEEMRVLEK